MTVTMHCAGETLSVDIHDDGVGGAGVETGATGLTGTADRATLSGSPTIR